MDSTTAMSYHTGLDGFIWFIGVVESRATDPLHVNRCKVRALGFHELDTRILPTADLPWALPLLPLTASRDTIDILEGDWVIGFFLDAQLAQQPIIFGKLPAYPSDGDVGSQP
jgi:hypothetical protein